MYQCRYLAYDNQIDTNTIPHIYEILPTIYLTTPVRTRKSLSLFFRPCILFQPFSDDELIELGQIVCLSTLSAPLTTWTQTPTHRFFY